jgi:hypothetical protein
LQGQRGEAWEWEGVVRWPRAGKLKGREMGSKINILNEKMDFLLSTNFKLLNRYKEIQRI